MWTYEETRNATTSTIGTWTAGSTSTYSNESMSTRSSVAAGPISRWTTHQGTIFENNEFGDSRTLFGTAGGWRTFAIGTASFTAWDVWIAESRSFSSSDIRFGTTIQTTQNSNSTATGIEINSLEFTTSASISGSNFADSGESRTTFYTTSLRRQTWADGSQTTTTFSSSQLIISQRTTTHTFLYYSSTSSKTITETATVTTLGFETAWSYGTTTGGGTTRTTTAFPATTSATQTQTTTTWTGSFATGSHNCLVDHIVRVDSTDWVWELTALGSDQVTSIGSTISDSTFRQRATTIAPSTWTPVTGLYSSAYNDTGSTETPGSSFTNTYWDMDDVSIATSTSTHVTSTYLVGAPSAGPLPMDATSTVARTYSTTTATTVWYQTLSSRTQGVFVNHRATGATVIVTYQDTITSSRVGDPMTFTTTFIGGYQYSTNHPDVEFETVMGTAENSTFSSTNSYNHGITRQGLQRVTPDWEGPLWDQTTSRNNWFQASSFAASPLSHDVPAVAGGFQNPGSVGGTYGTNLTGDGSVDSFGEFFPKVTGPLATQAIGAVGAIDNGLRRADSTGANAVGGFGWSRNATDRSQIRATQGIQRFTSYNSAGVSTTGFITATDTFTMEVSNGEAANFESVPKASLLTLSDTPVVPPLAYLSFSANPSE